MRLRRRNFYRRRKMFLIPNRVYSYLFLNLRNLFYLIACNKNRLIYNQLVFVVINTRWLFVVVRVFITDLIKILKFRAELQSAALGGHRCVSPAATLRSQRPPLLGGRFRFNHNSKMLRRPFQNGISRNLVIHNHRAPALRVSLRAGEGAKFHLAAFFQNLK